MSEADASITSAEIVIQQLNLSYHAEQDRLLLKVGLSDQTELALWLTQRIARTLWQLLNKEAHLPVSGSALIRTSQPQVAPQQAVQTFKQEVQAVEALQKLDFATAYQPRKEIQPGGVLIKDAQLLSQSTSASPSQVLEMNSVEGVQLKLNLNQESLLAICNMLQLCSKEAVWTLNASVAEPAALLNTESKQVLH